MTFLQNNITQPHQHDVLCGRGRGVTKHAGNIHWRQLIQDNQTQYMALPRNQRPIVTENIVLAIRSLNPPGRFLAKDPNTQLWYEIGQDKANEKTAQAMRDSKKLSCSTNSNSSTGSSSRVKQVRQSQQQQEQVQSAPLPVISVPSSTQPPATQTNNATPVVAQCSPNILKPKLDRINTSDTFCQRMQDWTFEPPLQRISSSMMSILSFRGSFYANNNNNNGNSSNENNNLNMKKAASNNNTITTTGSCINMNKAAYNDTTTNTSTNINTESSNLLSLHSKPSIVRRNSTYGWEFSMASMDMDLLEDSIQAVDDHDPMEAEYIHRNF